MLKIISFIVGIMLFGSMALANNFSYNPESIRNIRCGHRTGTGFIIDKDMVLTASHVADRGDGSCIDIATGAIGKIDYHNDLEGITLLIFDKNALPDTQMSYSCGGFVNGQHYHSLGWEFGKTMVSNDMVYTGQKIPEMALNDPPIIMVFSDMALLDGRSVPGVSGGPILDDYGLIIGTNQMSNYDKNTGIATHAYARELKDTRLCQR